MPRIPRARYRVLLSLLAAGAVATATALALPSGSPRTRPHQMSALDAARFWASSSSAGTAAIPSACTPQAPTSAIGYIYLVGEFGAVPGGFSPNGRITGNLTGNLVSAPGSLAAGPVAVPGITGKICGYVKLINGSQQSGCPVLGQLVLPAAGQEFPPSIAATITAIPGIRPQVPFKPMPQNITGTLVCNGGSSSAGLTASVNAAVGGGAGLFGLNCVVTVHIALNGTASGPILGPLQKAVPGWYLGGDFNTSNFTIPALVPTAACPPGVASNVDSLIGLPLQPGKATLNLPFALEVYVP